MNGVNCHYHFYGTGSSAAQTSVPLLPTDGGDFVALKKKSLTEEFSDPHLVWTSFYVDELLEHSAEFLCTL